MLESYVADVLTNPDSASRLVRLACERHRRDKDRDDLVFDVAAVQDWYELCRLMPHPRGDAAERGETFQPLPWQVFAVGSLIGWRVEATGHRRFRLGLIEVARGNGKTVLMGSVLLWAFLRGQGRQVYTFANTQRQAKLAYADARVMASAMADEVMPSANSDKRRWRDRTYLITETSMRDEQNRNRLEAIPAKENSLDGLDPYFWVGDEASEYQSRALQKLTTATVKRRSAFGCLITTPGSSDTTIYYQYRTEGVAVLDGSESGDGTFYYLAGIDEADDPADAAKWQKANPSLGHTVILEDLQQRYQSDLAKGPRFVAEFIRFHLCKYTGDVAAWIPAERWDACARPTRPDDELVGGRAWFGVDLSKTRDLSAIVGIIEHPVDGSLWVWGRYFYPEEQAKERERVLRMPILQWGMEGRIVLNPGRTIDYTQIHDSIRHVCNTYDVQACYFDPHLTGWGEQQLEAEGLPVYGLQQTTVQLSPGTLHVEELVAQERLYHVDDPVLARAIASSRTYTDVNMNVRIHKAKSDGPIDPAVSLCMAGRAHLDSVAMPDSCPVI